MFVYNTVVNPEECAIALFMSGKLYCHSFRPISFLCTNILSSSRYLCSQLFIFFTIFCYILGISHRIILSCKCVKNKTIPGRAVIKFRNLWPNPFLTMILYECNLKCLSYVYMGKIKYV